MWIIIFLLVIIAAALSFFYLVSRIRKFTLIKKISGESKKKSVIISAAAAIALSLALALTMGAMNAMVCLIHLVVIWLICDGTDLLIRRLTKKGFKFYYSGAAAFALTAIYLGIGWHLAHSVVRTSYSFKSDKITESLRIVQFADSHMGTTFSAEGFKKHVETMQAEAPDIVLITGDLVDDGTSREDMLGGCKALSGFKAKYGVYFTYGNHDKGYYDESQRGWNSDDLEKALTENGVVILKDECIPIGDDLILIGRKDLSFEENGDGRADMKTLTEDIDHERYMIVMDHQPHDYDAQADSGVDLVLSGHTHGGQFIPIIHVGEWIGANCRTYGHEKRKDTDFIVTSGISDWALYFKTGCRSEYVVIDICPE